MGFIVGIDVGFKDEKIDGVNVGSIVVGDGCGLFVGWVVGCKLGSYVCPVIEGDCDVARSNVGCNEMVVGNTAVSVVVVKVIVGLIEVSRIALPHKLSTSFAILLKSAWNGCILTL